MNDDHKKKRIQPDDSVSKNEDPMTGERGAHPVGVGLGAAAGGMATGAMAGAVTGPVGAAVGAVIGGVAGGLAGKAAAEAINPTEESAFWEENYPTRPYYNEERPFEDYQPAYQAGWESYEGTTWEQQEPVAKKKWESVSRWENEGGAPNMTWEEAKQAARDAHDRIVDRNRNRENIQQAIKRNPR